MMRTAWLILRKDMTVEVRSREIVYTTVFFAIACVLVFAFALVREGKAPEDGAAGILYRVIGYEERMPEVYAGADLLVTRAGAGTIAELATAGAPAIVVPWPGAAENHQVDNARQLSDRGGAILIEQPDFTADRLIAEIDRLSADRAALDALAANAFAAGERSRSGALIDVVERVAS